MLTVCPFCMVGCSAGGAAGSVSLCLSLELQGMERVRYLPAYVACFPPHIVKKLPWLLHKKFFMLPWPEAAG